MHCLSYILQEVAAVEEEETGVATTTLVQITMTTMEVVP